MYIHMLDGRIGASIVTFKHSACICLWSMSMDYSLAMFTGDKWRMSSVKATNSKKIKKTFKNKFIELFVNIITSTLTWAMNFSQIYWKGQRIFHSFVWWYHIRKKMKSQRSTHTHKIYWIELRVCMALYNVHIHVWAQQQLFHVDFYKNKMCNKQTK